MKRILNLALIVAAVHGTAPAQHHHGEMRTSKKSPALAALLSLQPLPVDGGSFYAGNWERGIVYSVAEVALFVPAIITLSQHGGWWGHHGYYYSDPSRRTWTPAERRRLYYLLGGYVLVKAVSAFDAGYCVERQHAGVTVGYDEKNRSVALSVMVPID